MTDRAIVIAGSGRPRVLGPIVAFAANSNLPTVYAPRDYVEEGGLIAYGVSIPENFRRSTSYVDKVLKGTKPGDLPVEQPTKLNLVHQS